MNILSSLKISTKIISLLMMLGVLTVGLGWYSSVPLNVADVAYSAITNQSFPVGVRAGRLVQSARQMETAVYRAIAYDGATPESRQAVEDERQAYELARTSVREAIALEPALAARLTAVGTKIDELHVATAQAVLLGRANKNAEALVAASNVHAIGQTIAKDMQALNNDKLAAALALSAHLSNKADSTSVWLLVLSIGGVAVAIGGSLVVSRVGITGPLDRLKAAMVQLADGNNRADIPGAERGDEIGAMAKVVLVFRETAVAKAAADAEKVEADATVQMVVKTLGASLSDLSNRDLTTRVDAAYPGLYAELKDNYNEAIGSVRTTIEQVSESARTISTGANEIAQASEDLARRTESNAASLEETSAALTQMESRLKATATASQSTVARADQAMLTVDSGRSTADTAMQAMGRVSDSAKGIDDVIEGLDKIAFQTRVLAMNAAVEAGRAGDAGRGFAVVADLVSALAMRAEEEAKRARDQLSVTQLEIVTAVDAVGKVDTALAAISTDVGEVNHLLAGMASDNQAQSSSITEITAAVSTMDHATQQNAAMVEETSAAARNLAQEVAKLAQAAAQFNVDGGARNPASEVGSLPDQASRLKVPQSGSRRPMQAARKPNYANPASYTSPIKPLPGAAISALVRPDSEDWNSF